MMTPPTRPGGISRLFIGKDSIHHGKELIVPLRSDKFGLFCLYESNSPADPEDHTAREKTCFRKRILEHNGVFRAYFADEALTDAEATQALARRLVSSWIRAKPEVR